MASTDSAAQSPRKTGRVPAGRRALWRRPWARGLVWQALLVGLFVWLIAFLLGNVNENLPRSGLTVGFDFVDSPTRFEIGPNYLGATARDPVWYTFLVGAFNTLRVSLMGILICTVLGLAIALARLSDNWLLSRMAFLWVETVRNIPLLLQMLFWYGLSTLLPLPKQAWEPIADVFFTNRGIYHPALVLQPAHWWVIGALMVAILAALFILRAGRRYRERSGQSLPTGWIALALLLLLPTLAWIFSGAGTEVHYPALRGFNFRGGGLITPEFVAVVIALSVYQSGFAAETFRSGIVGVKKGQWEAARSLGLPTRVIYGTVVLPQALRIVVPPLTSQYLSLTKNSSLAVVIGYPELVRVSTAVTAETGRAIECIAIMMSVYLTLSLLTSAFMNWYNKRIAFVES
ncbi:MAG: amino acid ABC transporter permease [Rhodospirillales bacterium]